MCRPSNSLLTRRFGAPESATSPRSKSAYETSVLLGVPEVEGSAVSVNADDWNDEWRSANRAMTELERAHIVAPDGLGDSLGGEKEDARDN